VDIFIGLKICCVLAWFSVLQNESSENRYIFSDLHKKFGVRFEAKMTQYLTLNIAF